MGVTTVFPRPSRPIKGGSRNLGAAKRSPAPERDRHEEGACSLVRRGFSRVLPGLKDVPGEAAAGAWGPDGRGERGRTSGFSQSVAARRQQGQRGFGAAVSRVPLSRAHRPGSPGIATSRGGRGAPPTRTRPFPSSQFTGAPPPRPVTPQPHSRVPDPTRARWCPPSAPHPWCALLSPFLAA